LTMWRVLNCGENAWFRHTAERLYINSEDPANQVSEKNAYFDRIGCLKGAWMNDH
jgi:hypothetical protein